MPGGWLLELRDRSSGTPKKWLMNVISDFIIVAYNGIVKRNLKHIEPEDELIIKNARREAE